MYQPRDSLLSLACLFSLDMERVLSGALRRLFSHGNRILWNDKYLPPILPITKHPGLRETFFFFSVKPAEGREGLHLNHTREPFFFFKESKHVYLV